MIFTDLAQRVRFAFVLAQYPGEPPAAANTAVRAALAHVRAKPQEVTAQLLVDLRVEANQVTEQVQALPAYERAALIAAYSSNWDDKRTAMDTLRSYFTPLLARMVDNPRLVERLVKRHYIARRDRGSGWSQDDIAREFSIGMERLAHAVGAVDQHAKVLEHAALQTLQAHVDQVESANA
jgi:phage terminase large subunit-like protein